MEGEIGKYIEVWISALASLTYCYFISFNISKGMFRFLSLLPVFYLFTVLPLNLTTFCFCSTTGFFLTWVCNFNLLLFSFGEGPLCTNPSISLAQFISIACFPIKIKSKQHPSPLNTNPTSSNHEKPLNIRIKENPSPPISSKSTRCFKSYLHLALKIFTFVLLNLAYKHKQHIHSKIMIWYHICYTYLALELFLVTASTLARFLLGMEFEPLFKDPHLSTSLQDLWGRRWNLAASTILRHTVYQPTKGVLENILGRKMSALLAILSTFLVSGFMHEIIYYQVGRETPTWEVTWFFVLHGVLVVAEYVGKKVTKGKMRLHRVVSGACTLGILVVTAELLFLPQLRRCNADVRARQEIFDVLHFVKNLGKKFA